MEKAPSGSPDFESISPKIEADIGVLSDGFNTKGHPAAMAGPTLCALIVS
jgi:hypothetical protein